MRYAVVTAVAQGTSYAVFAVLVLTVLAALPQAAIVAGAAVGALISYNGHRLFAFAPCHADASGTSGSSELGALMTKHVDVFVIGAGPAGLTAAYCLTKERSSVLVIEKDPVYVGGISRTVRYKDFLFDIGGHRFFSKAKEVVDLWHEILPDDFIERPRLSRIFYGGKFYSYPLSAFQALTNLGLFTSAACMLSYAYAKAAPDQGRANVPSLGAQSVRRKAVLDLLQDLHRKGVGHVVRRDFRRLGGAADQGPRPRRRGHGMRSCARSGRRPQAPGW